MRLAGDRAAINNLLDESYLDFENPLNFIGFFVYLLPFGYR